MATQVPAKLNAAFSFEVALADYTDYPSIKTSPTLEAGDVQVSIDGGAFSNIASLPTEIGSTGILTVTLTAAEMNGDRIIVLFQDQSGSEWYGLMIQIMTASQQIDDLATPQGVWDTLTSALTTAGSIGKLLVDKLPLITSGSVTVTAPVAADGDVTIVEGDDYKAADSRALEWSSDGWPDLTGATITFKTSDGALEKAVTATVVGGGTQTVRMELDDTDTDGLGTGQTRLFAIKATLASGNEVTLVRGDVTIQDNRAE